MSVENVLSKPAEKKQVFDSRTKGTGTAVSGYVNDPTPKKCETCEYLVSRDLCRNKRVKKDPEIPTDPHSGLKIVDPENGCCSWWTADPDWEQDRMDEVQGHPETETEEVHEDEG